MAEQDIKTVEIKLEDFFTKVLSVIGKITDQQIADLLKKSKQTVSVAESVTGGLIAGRLTNVAGSSDYFVGGIVCYNPRIKVIQVGISASLISQHGIVSKEVAIALAEEIKKRFRTDIGIASTGVAGPAPIPPAPVGKVFIALASDKETEWKELNLQGTRSEIREKAAQAALGLLWLYLGGDEILK
ncbi:MAG: CinA family protein [Candidatus Margulisbacteria bacterium]|nr:CinA family protein [Candidatus Margulisiibacteriota bacterium]